MKRRICVKGFRVIETYLYRDALGLRICQPFPPWYWSKLQTLLAPTSGFRTREVSGTIDRTCPPSQYACADKFEYI
jgi:hypothetical protein